MTKKKKLRKAILIVPAIVLIAVSLIISYNGKFDYRCKEINDANTEISYLSFDNASYPLINYDSADAGLFSVNTVDRISDIYLYDGDFITTKDDDIIKIDRGPFQIKSYGYKKITEDNYLYFEIEDNKAFKYYAHAGFELPKISADNIDHIRVWYLDDDKGKSNIIKDRSIIEQIINSPVDYFAKNNIQEMYVTYKNYDLEEWFDAQKIMQNR